MHFNMSHDLCVCQATYCDQFCQKLEWFTHKKRCKKIAAEHKERMEAIEKSQAKMEEEERRKKEQEEQAASITNGKKATNIQFNKRMQTAGGGHCSTMSQTGWNLIFNYASIFLQYCA